MDIIIKKESLHDIVKQIEVIGDSVKQKFVDPKTIIYNNDQLANMLGVSKSTLQKMRTEGYLSYSQIKGKFFYRHSDIDDMLVNNLTKQFRNEYKK
jgi:DNA-binding FadR family transcriptional regulator